jgi:acyl-CoA hydrolase
MDVQELYRSKLTDVTGALSHIQDGDSIMTGAVGVEPAYCLSQLHTLNGKVHDIHFMSGLGMSLFPFMTDPACQETFSTDCIFFMGPARKAHRMGHVNVFPGHLHNGAIRWSQAHDGRTVFMVAVTPMDRHGYFRIPLSVIHERYMLEHADVVIVEVNPNLPTVFGDTEVHIREVDYVVEAEPYDLPTVSSSTPNETEKIIGQYIAELVPDGSCIQLGIGGIPDAAAHALVDKHDLGVHTEMLTNSLVDLVEAGAITCAKKNVNPGKMVGAFALGDQRLYDMIDENPGVALMRGQYVNNPMYIAQNDNFVSINTGLTMDLTGQVCSETIGSLHYSGSGGQADTAIGALHSKGGKNIIAMPSCKHTKNGVVSSINAQLPLGSTVTLSRNDIDYIVTEYGIASLRGRSVRDRVERLIAVAHPDFRNQLRKDAERLMLW